MSGPNLPGHTPEPKPTVTPTRIRNAAALLVAAAVGAGTVAIIRPYQATNIVSSQPHVMVIMEENKGYAATLGACSADPYLCGLASTYASVVGWTGVSHPSEPNYVAFESGGIQGCTTDTSCAAFSVKATDLGGQLTAAGIPWVSWQESMPSACYTGQTATLYALKHSFGGFFADDKTPCNIQPYPGSSAMLSVLNGPAPPDFAWITPNLDHDMHNGTVQQGDAFLSANLAPVLASPWFLNFDSTVIVTMDEGNNPGSINAIPLVMISSNAKGTGNVSLKGNHYGTLRSIEETFGLSLLGSASSASNGDISSLFGSPVPPPTPTPSATSSPTASPTATPSASPTLSGLVCNVAAGVDAPVIQAALKACANGGTVSLAAGTYMLTNHLVPYANETITGAGQFATFLVQTARINILQIVQPGVTVEDMSVDTGTFNPGVPPIPKNPVPATIFSNASHTSIINVTSNAGTGFGIRITPQGGVPCESFNGTGTVVTNVSSTNTGTGGFTALDIDCTNGAVLTNVTIHGAAIAFYEDENVTMNGEVYAAGPYASNACPSDWFVTGPSNHISLSNIVTSNGKGKSSNTSHGVVTFLTVTNETFAPGDLCTNGI